MPFEFVETRLPDVVLVKPKVFFDERGFFLENFKKSEFARNGINLDVVQSNYSKSSFGVIRGLHYQREPYAQSKLVRCIKGLIFDVAFDIRKESEYYGQYVSAELSEENKHMLFIPKGFAHGFQVLSEEAEIEYLVDNEYAPDYEDGIIWNDESIGIEWPIKGALVSEKDEGLRIF